MMRTNFVFSVALLAAATSADGGVLGFACFGRTAGNGNRILDIAVVTERASDRLLNVFNVMITGTFIQQAGTATRGWKPDAASSNRSNIVDSFCTIGVEGGAPYYGQYYASGATGADGGFSTGWTTASTTIPANAGWFSSPPTLPDSVSESLANFSGNRANSSTAAAAGSFGVWCVHLVFAPGSFVGDISMTASVKDGVSGATTAGSAAGTWHFPSPGALAFLGIAGAAGTRRRREV